MDRKLYSEYFTSCGSYLSKEVTEIDTIRYAINVALGNDSSSEFSDSTLRTNYNSIVNRMANIRGDIVNHQIYLGKRKSNLDGHDTGCASKLRTTGSVFEGTKVMVNMFAEAMHQSAIELSGDDVNLYSLISKVEIEASIAIEAELGKITYADFMKMSQDQQEDIINKALNIVAKGVADGTFVIPENGKLGIPVAPGVTMYVFGSGFGTIGDDDCAVDIDTTKTGCLHSIISSDAFLSQDVSINTSWQMAHTETKKVDDNTEIYTKVCYDPVNESFFFEKGINAVVASKTNADGKKVSAALTAGCGMQIYKPTKWKYKKEYRVQPVNPGIYVIPVPIPIPAFEGAGAIEALRELYGLSQLAPAY